MHTLALIYVVGFLTYLVGAGVVIGAVFRKNEAAPRRRPEELAREALIDAAMWPLLAAFFLSYFVADGWYTRNEVPPPVAFVGDAYRYRVVHVMEDGSVQAPTQAVTISVPDEPVMKFRVYRMKRNDKRFRA